MDMEALYDKIYRYCYRRLQSREAAEDAAQEAFARWLASGVCRSGNAAARYLYAVARNLCVDEYRRKKPEPLPPDLPGQDIPLEALALRQAVAALSQEEQELILMRYVNCEPVSVIAGALGVSRFAVYRRTSAALRRLRGREALYAVAAVAVLVAGLALALHSGLDAYAPANFRWWLLALASAAVLTGREYRNTIKRTEELSWN